MPSFLTGYEYDIFISYRQNDNRYDGWVTEFVTNLKAELEATMKGKVNVYFDENPKDGLLESHNVDASLLPKLHALILIPIVSQTYCDPESFAWNQEFLAFLKIISGDKFGPTVKLAGGNVANRVLPVRIHELDTDDVALFENSTKLKFRPIDFIYKESGVNRPLRANEDSPSKNLNQTLYRNQINKVANAVKEIITGLRNADRGIDGSSEGKQAVPESKVKQAHSFTKIALLSSGVIVALLLATLVYQFFKSHGTENNIAVDVKDKSIAVIPFADMSSGHDQEYFADGMMDEILNHLVKIGELHVPSRTTSMKYRNTHLSAKEIGQELGVAYILEGSVRKEGDVVRITVQLIDTQKDQHEWSENYDRPMMASSLLAVQSDVAQQVARILKVKISPDVKKSIERLSTENTSAYTLYLKLKAVFWKIPLDSVKVRLDEILKLDPHFAPAVASLAFYYILRGGYTGDLSREQVIENALPLLRKALELDSSLVETHGTMARYHLYFEWDFEAAEREFNTVSRLAPASPRGYGYYNFLYATGQNKKALVEARKTFDRNNNEVFNWEMLADAYAQNKLCDDALNTVKLAKERFPKDQQDFEHQDSNLKLLCSKNPAVLKQAREFLAAQNEKDYSEINDQTPPRHLEVLAVDFFQNGQPAKTKVLLEKLVALTKLSGVRSPSYFTSQVYAVMGKTDLAFQYLEKAYADREIEMYQLKSTREFNSLHTDLRWKELLRKMKLPASQED